MLLRQHNTMEVATTLALFIIVAVVGLDVSIASVGSANDDAACKDAARLAANAEDATSALRLAQKAVAAHHADGYFVATPQVTAAEFIYEDYGGNPPGHASPYVAVVTTTSVHVPAPLLFSEKVCSQDGTITFSHRTVLPIERARVAQRTD